jgi:multicomponent Na+:H+ antiporter subunit B
MSPPIVLRTVARVLVTVFPLVAVFLLVRGHDFPGGGFIAGLVAATAVILFAIAFEPASARRLLRIDPGALIVAGVAVALASGLPALLLGQPFMTGQWGELNLAGLARVKVGTPLMFDVGVFLTVVGATLIILLALEEESEWR